MKEYIGMNISDFRKLYPGIIHRVVRNNNNPMVVTCDFKPGRLNITLENNIIVKIKEE